MNELVRFIRTDWQSLVIPIGVLVLVLLLGLVAKRLLFRGLERWASRTHSRAVEIVGAALRGPFMIWVLILAVHLAAQISDLPRRQATLVGRALLVLWIISFTLAAARLAERLVRFYGGSLRSELPVTSLSQNLARLAVISIGILILLNVLGVSITPILTALGVGGLAVALALQDTLSNFFAGFYISLARQIRMGDYIKLSGGEEGYVADISWRSTSIRTLPNNLVIIPNAKLAQEIITNYSLPENRMSLLIPVSVSYECDPDMVERVLVQEATRAAGDVKGLLADPAPFVRFIPGFGDSSLNFTLICQVEHFVDQYLVQHELRKLIFRRFRALGIEIPFPIQTVYLRGAANLAAGAHD